MRKLLYTLILLKAIYTPANGTDPEYGQSAIERCDLAHREIRQNVWLIRGDENDDWQAKLNAAATHGTFVVRQPTDDEKKRVASGEITLQK